MTVAIKAPLTSRAQAYAAAHPDASPAEIARVLGVRTAEIAAALRRDRRPRRKSTAG
jgi:ABC-type nitrate/sulfonate/bicarbonate transport system substrate-binding protein